MPAAEEIRPGASSSDAELMARCMGGDNEAFVQVIQRHEAAIGRYISRQVGPNAVADVQADVWIAAYGSRHRYDLSYPDARPWLYSIARNQVRSLWRATPPEDLVPDTAQTHHLWTFDPWPVVNTHLDVQYVLQRAIRRLPADEREVMVLIAGEDLTSAAAARVLDIPAGTVRRLLHQARQRLRRDPGVAGLLDQINGTAKEGA